MTPVLHHNLQSEILANVSMGIKGAELLIRLTNSYLKFSNVEIQEEIERLIADKAIVSVNYYLPGDSHIRHFYLPRYTSIEVNK